MKILDLLKNLITSLYASLKRFPVAIGLSVLATIFLIILTHNEQNFSSYTQKTWERIIATMALGIPAALCIKLSFERRAKISLAWMTSFYFIGFLGLGLYYFFLLTDFTMVTVTRYIAFSLSLYVAFTFIPYFFKREGFELYVMKLLTRFFTTVIYSIVLFLGIAITLFTINQLLEIRIAGRIYLDAWLVVVGIFAPSFFLSGVPLFHEQFEAKSYPKLLKVLLLYIVMPLIAIYTGILYIYFAKILVTLQWPNGLVGHLVLWYAVLCTAILFLISPLQGENKWAKIFGFWFPKLLLPLMIMMFISVGIRVKAYGITENRYFVIVLGLWAFAVMLYLNLAKKRKNIVMLISLALVLFLAVFGPWSSYDVSKYSQNKRLEGILVKYNMLKYNSIVKADQELLPKDKREIGAILHYFATAHNLNEVKYLPKNFKLDQMQAVFGFEQTEYSGEHKNQYFSYSINLATNPLEIKGYDYLISSNTYSSSTDSPDAKLAVEYNAKTKEIIIKSGQEELYRQPLVAFVEQLYKKYGAISKYNFAQEMSLLEENEKIKVKIVFNRISGSVSEDELNIDAAEFYVLLSLK